MMKATFSTLTSLTLFLAATPAIAANAVNGVLPGAPPVSIKFVKDRATLDKRTSKPGKFL